MLCIHVRGRRTVLRADLMMMVEMTSSTIAVPLLTFVGFGVAYVLVATILVAFVEVCVLVTAVD